MGSNYCTGQCIISKHSKKKTKVISLDEKARFSFMSATRGILYTQDSDWKVKNGKNMSSEP